MSTFPHTSPQRQRRKPSLFPCCAWEHPAWTLRVRSAFPRGGTHARPAFTLIELTIVIAIIAILAAMALPVINAAYQQSKVHRTRAIVAKLDQLIGEKYESYRTRQVPIRINPTLNLPPRQIAAIRLNAIRELMRMELPDSASDIVPAFGGSPVVLISANGGAAPALWRQYTRRALPGWSASNQSAECLYLILAAMRDGDKNALDFFSPSEIGDTDGDQMPEILDAWGQPIHFLRWAPAYRADITPFPVTPQTMADPDPYDPLKVDPRWTNGAPFTPFALKPLIWSDGPDKRIGINFNTPIDPNTGVPMVYAASTPPNDPYMADNTGMPVVGGPVNTDATDNITNHDLEAR